MFFRFITSSTLFLAFFCVSVCLCVHVWAYTRRSATVWSIEKLDRNVFSARSWCHFKEQFCFNVTERNFKAAKSMLTSIMVCYLMCTVLVHTMCACKVMFVLCRIWKMFVCVWVSVFTRQTMNDAVVTFSNNVSLYNTEFNTHGYHIDCSKSEILIHLLNGHKFASRKYNTTIKWILTTNANGHARAKHIR